MTRKTVKICFIDKDSKEIFVDADIGLSILEIAHKNDINLEGACGAALACSTCHVILEERLYDALPEASEEEEDMLDLAFGLTRTSRLGCQIIVTEDMEGSRVSLPAATRNIMLDG